MPCHHVVERLSRRHRVFYIDNFGGIRDLNWSDLNRGLAKFRRCSSPFSVVGRSGNRRSVPAKESSGRSRAEVAGEIIVDHPVIVPTPRIPLLQVLNGLWLNHRLKRLVREHRIKNPIIWSRLPTELVWRAISGVDRSLLVYQMIDKFPEHPKIAASLRKRHGFWERNFTESADLVFASARGLWEEKKAINPESYFFPNGVSEIFSETRRPAARTERHMPRVGFAGAVGTSLDIDWLIEVARLRPQYEFVLLGTVDPGVDVSGLRRLPNIRLQGRVEHESLPEWFGGFDAAFMAYRYNNYQRFTFPSKMAEYLLAGLPVASNRLPEVEPYGEVVYISDSPGGMAEDLDRAVEERRDEAKCLRRRKVGESLSWGRIVDEMEAVIERRLKGNGVSS